MNPPLAWLLALSVVLTPAHRASADEPVRRAEDIVVEEQMLRPAEIFQDTPVETELLTAEEIESLPARDASQVVRSLPGIRTQQRIQGEEAVVSIEGMPPEYTHVLVGGQRYTGEVGGVSDLRDVPLENVERIEILRGSQSLRYGSDAAGGVIRIVPRDPPDDGLQADLNGGYGTDNDVQGSGTVGFGAANLGGQLSFDHDQIDGFNAPSDTDAVFVGGNSDSRRRSRDTNGTFVWRPSESLLLRSTAGFRYEDQIYAFDDVDEKSTRDDRRWRGVQEVEWVASETTRLSGAFTYYFLETNSEVGRDFRLDEDEWKLDLAGERYFEIFGVDHTLTLGLDARLDRLRLDEGEAPESVDPTVSDLSFEGARREDFNHTGIYLVGESELTRWFSAEYGLRVQLHSKFDTEYLPQIALVLKPLETLRLRFSYGRNHRNPSLRDLFQPAVPQLGGAYFLEGSPDLVPESSKSFRAGLEYTPRSWLSCSVVGFYNEIEDNIRSNIDRYISIGTVTEDDLTCPPPVILETFCSFEANQDSPCCNDEAEEDEFEQFRPVFKKTNLDSVKTRGAEVRLELRPHRSFDMQLGYTLLDTEVVDSNLIGLAELPNSPKHTIDARIRVEAPRTRTGLTLRGRWRDKALIEGSGTGLLGFATQEYGESSFLLDGRLSQPVGERVEIYADALNLTDEREVDSYVIRGRTFFVGLRARF